MCSATIWPFASAGRSMPTGVRPWRSAFVVSSLTIRTVRSIRSSSPQADSVSRVKVRAALTALSSETMVRLTRFSGGLDDGLQAPVGHHLGLLTATAEVRPSRTRRQVSVEAWKLRRFTSTAVPGPPSLAWAGSETWPCLPGGTRAPEPYVWIAFTEFLPGEGQLVVWVTLSEP